MSNVYREKSVFDTLQDWECERLKIPPVPVGVHNGAQYFTEERLRSKNYGKMPKDLIEEYYVQRGIDEREEVRQWLPSVVAAIELPASELFVKLRRGQIEAQGKLLPPNAEIIDFLEDQNSYGRSDYDDLVDTVIPPEFWTLPGIDWLSNAVTAHGAYYCDVSISVQTLMSQFPGERMHIEGAELVGDCVFVKADENDRVGQLPRRPAGRPPAFAWESFHVEVAELIRKGGLPRKKEAAIQLMTSWFETAHRQKPSRSAISERLTPYYRRFFPTAE